MQAVTETTADARLALWGDLALADPVFLFFVPVALVALFIGVRRRGRVAARLPRLPHLRLPRTLGQRLAWLPTALKLAALLLAVGALSRPLEGTIETQSHGEGVDIALVLDRSSSMEARGGEGEPRRFDIARAVLEAFARRRMTDTEGIADNVALFGFARFTDLLCPFTLDADAMTGVLAGLDVVTHRDLDATGIGVALAKTVDVFRGLDANSKVVILLTDGMENVDVIPPIRAGKLAAEEGIKVYTIFAGPKEAYYRGVFGLEKRVADTTDLERIAELTDALFFHAETAEELEAVYAEIETLERREREEERFAEHLDLYPGLLLPAFLLYVLAWLSACTWARRLP